MQRFIISFIAISSSVQLLAHVLRDNKAGNCQMEISFSFLGVHICFQEVAVLSHGVVKSDY